MTSVRFKAMATNTVAAYQAGALDANGQQPERHVSNGDGVPCRHCLSDVAEGDPYLILAHRPFPQTHPYAEVGPIFLHADGCNRYTEESNLPDMFLERDRFLIRGYGKDDRIVYGTGRTVATDDMEMAAAALFGQPDIAYIHVRSGSYNCYQCRIERH